jgi:hypothetical protein
MSLFSSIGKVLGLSGSGGTGAPSQVGTWQREYYAPKIGGYYGTEQEIQKQQAEFLDQLRMAAQGQGPSVAEAFSRQASDQALANALAMAASARGGVSPGMAYRNALNAAAQNQAQAAQQASVMRQQEMLNAMQAYGQGLGTARAQDQSMLQFYEDLGMRGDVANLGSQDAAKQRRSGVVGGILSGIGQVGAAALQGRRV